MSGPPRAIAIVPARLASTRLPRKLLLRATGRYLFEHTVRNAERAKRLERVLLAVDDPALANAAADVGVEAMTTSVEHQSGTDRVLEALERTVAGGAPEPDVVVNVQGDEPDVEPEDLDRLVDLFRDARVRFATLWVPLEVPAQAARPEIVKLVTDAVGRALYFSRAPIPAQGHAGGVPAHKRHLGVYAYRPDALREFCAAPVSSLERTERLEQLRWLELGGAIHTLEAARAPRGIDTDADYQAFVDRHATQVDARGRPDPATPSPTDRPA